MRVAYVLKKFPRISETFILNEILELERQGADVTVFSLHSPNDGLFHRRLSELKRPVAYLPARKSLALLGHLREHLPLLRESREGLWSQLEELLASGKTDVWQILGWGLDVAIEARARGIEHLHAHFATVATWVARAASATGGVPYSFTCHAKDIYRETVEAELFGRLAAPARFVVTVCDANRRHIAEHLLPGSDPPVLTLYNGVDLDAFSPARRHPEEPPLVLGVGRLVEKKGFRHLIAAAGELARNGQDLRCVIVGEGEERPVLESLIAEQGSDKIALAGMRTQDEVRALLDRASVLALPCVVGEDGNRDALPTVLLEAMACGVPVISTPVGGVEEIVDGGRAGVLVPPGDAGALRSAIAGLLGDEAERQRLSRHGREQAERCFDLRQNVARLRSWFESGPPRTERAR